MKLSTTKVEKQVNAHPFLWSTMVKSFKHVVWVLVAPKKGATLVSIRHSKSIGTAFHLLHSNYVFDSEGTQHNKNYQIHAIDIEGFLLKDHHGAHDQPFESSSWLAIDTEASSVTQPISRSKSQLARSARWSFPNLLHFALAWKPWRLRNLILHHLRHAILKIRAIV